MISFFCGEGGWEGAAGERDWGDIHPRTYVLTGPSQIMLSFLYSSDFFLLQLSNELC